MTTTVRTIFSINATDRSHDFLVIRRGPAGISIEAQSREDEWESATAGPFTPEHLRAALDEVAPAGSYTRTDEQPRPLTADDITDEMVQRGAQAATPAGVRYLRPHEVREVLTAALTEPTRPEGAEEIEAYMRELVASHPEDHYGELADHLASRGVLPPLTDKTHPEEQP